MTKWPVQKPTHRTTQKHVEHHDATDMFFSACGGTYTNFSGILQSVNYPGNYLDNMNCDYIITLPPGYTIAMTVADMHTEEGSDLVTVSTAG